MAVRCLLDVRAVLSDWVSFFLTLKSLRGRLSRTALDLCGHNYIDSPLYRRGFISSVYSACQFWLFGFASQFTAMSRTELGAPVTEPATCIPELSLIRPLGILCLLLPAVGQRVPFSHLFIGTRLSYFSGFFYVSLESKRERDPSPGW